MKSAAPDIVAERHDHRYDQPTAGRMRVEVSDGYPVMCKLFVDGNQVAVLHHRDLSDTSYVIARAKEAAREKLGHQYREV